MSVTPRTLNRPFATVGHVTDNFYQCRIGLRFNDDLNIAKIRRYCMEARKLCPQETFSVINHNQRKLLAYNYWRQKEEYNIRKNGNF